MMDDPIMQKDRHSGRPLGILRCAYSPSADPAKDCGRDATWHIMWDESHAASLSCDEHMELVQRSWVYLYRHPLGSDCNMPGALWFFEPNVCQVPSSEFPVLRAAEHTVAAA